MTSPAGSLDELRDALTDAGVRVATPGSATPPCVLVGGPTGTWFDLSRVRTGVPITWRVLLVAGSWDDAAALAQLVALADLVAYTLHGLPGWRLGDVGRFGSLELAGARYLAADLVATVNATLSTPEV